MSVWKFLLRLSVGALLVWFLLKKHELDVQMVVSRMAGMQPWPLAGALLINLAGQSLCAYRWGLLSCMGGRKARFRDVLPVYFSGMFFNMCLPTSIGGDVFRVVGLGRKTGSKSAAFASVFMDRNVGLGALLLVGLVGSIIAQTTVHATVFEVPFEYVVWPAFLVLGVGYILANIALFHERFYNFITGLLDRLKLPFLNNKLKPLHDALGSYHLPLEHYIPAFLISLVYQASEVGLIWLLAYGLQIDLSPWVFCSMVTFQAVACMLPITFAGAGVREAIFTAMIVGKLGADYKDDAMALSLIYFFGVVLISSLIGGMIYLIGGVPKPTPVEIAETVTDAAGE
jgi:uncharacterized protein (TIRG00374 family)